MATDKQISANQRNAQRSTGPRTSEGKAVTRLNAVKHALTGQLTLVAPGQYEAYAAVEHRMLASLAPVGEQELQLAARMIRDTWRLARAAACEDNVFALELGKDDSNIIVTENGDPARDAHLHAVITDTCTWANRRRDFERATLYEQRINRGLHRDYALFRELQKDRNREETKYYAKPGAPQVAVAASQANTPLCAAPVASANSNGFDFAVFQTAPVPIAADRKIDCLGIEFNAQFAPPSQKDPSNPVV